MDRLVLLHNVMTRLVGGLYAAPIDKEKTRRILDIGTGNGACKCQPSLTLRRRPLIYFCSRGHRHRRRLPQSHGSFGFPPGTWPPTLHAYTNPLLLTSWLDYRQRPLGNPSPVRPPQRQVRNRRRRRPVGTLGQIRLDLLPLHGSLDPRLAQANVPNL